MRTIPLLFMLASALDAQAPAFDVASIKPYLEQGGVSSIRASVGRIRMDGVSLRKLTLWAYGIPDDREYALIGPDWLGGERFIIEATFPSDTKPDDVRKMTQTLLADRFHQAVHRENRQLPMYALVVGKGGLKIHPVEAGPGRTSGGLGKLEATKISMQKLSDMLARITGRPVTDETAVPGVYDFTLEWVPDDAPAEATGHSLQSALQEQLGLKLEGRKGPVDVVVIDRMDKTPTGN